MQQRQFPPDWREIKSRHQNQDTNTVSEGTLPVAYLLPPGSTSEMFQSLSKKAPSAQTQALSTRGFGRALHFPTAKDFNQDGVSGCTQCVSTAVYLNSQKLSLLFRVCWTLFSGSWLLVTFLSFDPWMQVFLLTYHISIDTNISRNTTCVCADKAHEIMHLCRHLWFPP